LSKLVASNTDEDVAKATKAAFQYYASNSTDVTGTLNLLSKPLKGVGPATASLYLAIHDPTRIIFFSDEAYRWLVSDAKLKYDVKEYGALHKATQDFMKRLSVTPIEVEKVAFVLVKEGGPVKQPNLSTGKPPSRPERVASEQGSSPAPNRRSGRSPQTARKSPENKEAKSISRSASEQHSSAMQRGKQAKKTKGETEDQSQDDPKKRRRSHPDKVEQDTEDSSSGNSKKRGRPQRSKNENNAKRLMS